MSDIAVRGEGVTNLYPIGRTQEKYKTFHNTVTDAFGLPFCGMRILAKWPGDRRWRTG